MRWVWTEGVSVGRERVEGGYKADYGKRGGERGCLVRDVERGGVLLVMDKDEGGYQADYGERIRQRCFCSLW